MKVQKSITTYEIIGIMFKPTTVGKQAFSKLILHFNTKLFIGKSQVLEL